ncbi:hypothetical protein BH09ACT6_BH09ACT6_11020 [soil metagenome]
MRFAARPDPLSSDDHATHAIHQASRGYPRAVNNLAIAALIATYAADKSIIDLAAAQSAITENSERVHRIMTDDHHITTTIEAPPETTGGPFRFSTSFRLVEQW